jgi:hypothetical protein
MMLDSARDDIFVNQGSNATSARNGIEVMGQGFTAVNEEPDADTVPTIMLSTSTAAMPLSLESYQSVTKANPPPLAVRRGHTGPPSLPLPLLPTSADDSYPGIPTAFGGSPNAYTPKFEFCESGGDFSMDLEAMCQDLRLRCPLLTPPSPIMTSDVSCLSNGSPLLGCSTTSDSDEWGFARELLQVHIERSVISSSVGHEPMNLTSAGLLGDASVETPSVHNFSDVSWSTDPTLINSPKPIHQTELPADLSEDKDKPSKTISELPKQQRRRTVIIETPYSNTAGVVRPVRMTIDLSHLAEDEDSVDVMSSVVTEIPFESRPQESSHTLFKVPSTPTNFVRPISSASMGRPVRSILKTREKKSVRFSELPSMHEYTVEERELESVFEVDEREDLDKSDAKAAVKKRPATTLSTKARRKSSKAELNDVGDDNSVRASFLKHSTARSKAQPSTPTTSYYSSPTPVGHASKLGRQSLLVDRTTNKADIGHPKRLARAPVTRSSLPADSGKSMRKKQFQDENIWRRSSTAEKDESSNFQKSRMPFRSILTRLRS